MYPVVPPRWPIGSTPTACSASGLAVDRVDGADGIARLVLKLPTWEDYLGVAVDEIIGIGLGSILVRRGVSGPREQSSRSCHPSTTGQIEVRLETVNAYLEP